MLAELRRRNVHRVAIAYLAAAWLLVQVVDTLTPTFFPEAVFRGAVIALAIGFIPALILAWIFEWTAEGLQRETNVAAETPRSDSRLFDRVITVTLLLAVAYFAVDKFVIDPERDKAAIHAATEQALADAFIGEFRDRSIIVLPFLNMSSDPEQEYFADGISEELLNLLAGIEELRVISRSTSWTFKGKEIDVADMRHRLDVSHVLEGSVRKAGDQIRVTVQLIDARTDSHLWSETYDRSFQDIFRIQDEISAAVVDQLKLELLTGAPTAEEIDPDAYELYLKGRYISFTLGGGPRAMEAVNYLTRAIVLEPQFLPAISELANVHKGLATGPGMGQDREYHWKQLRRVVDRLFDIAPDSSYTHEWLAWLAGASSDFEQTAYHLEQAIATASNTHLSDVLAFASYYLRMSGRYAEAEIVARYVMSRDPACGNCVLALANALRYQDRHREAAEAIEAQLGWRELRRSDIWPLGISWLVAGEPGKALGYFDQMDEPNARRFMRTLALYSMGRTDEFETEFAAFRASSEDDPEGIARVYAWAGDADQAYAYLRKHIETNGEDDLADSLISELYEPVSADPRIRALIERVEAMLAILRAVPFDPEYPPALQARIDAMNLGPDT